MVNTECISSRDKNHNINLVFENLFAFTKLKEKVQRETLHSERACLFRYQCRLLSVVHSSRRLSCFCFVEY